MGIIGHRGPEPALILDDTVGLEFNSAKLTHLAGGAVLTWAKAGRAFSALTNESGEAWKPVRMIPFTESFERSVSAFQMSDGSVHLGFQRSALPADSASDAVSANIITRTIDTVSTTTRCDHRTDDDRPAEFLRTA